MFIDWQKKKKVKLTKAKLMQKPHRSGDVIFTCYLQYEGRIFCLTQEESKSLKVNIMLEGM